jgi:hypothetical protein
MEILISRPQNRSGSAMMQWRQTRGINVISCGMEVLKKKHLLIDI